MPCTSPIKAFQSKDGGPLHFHKRNEGDRTLQVPCNQCGDCRVRRLTDWGMRMVHHASQYDENCFLTLTYDDANLPEDGGLYKPHLQKFFKRLRHTFPIRNLSYYACGEYGERTQRAHYHVCLFNADFNDKIHFRQIGEHRLYISEKLNKLWGHGNTSIGSLTYQTACYTAAYVMKATLGKGCPRYVRVDEATGELIPIQQPFAVMSNGGGRRESGSPPTGGIGASWLRKYHGDIYNAEKDLIRINGKALKPARYYDKLYDSINPPHMAKIKEIRLENHTKETLESLRARAINTHARKIHKTQM